MPIRIRAEPPKKSKKANSNGAREFRRKSLLSRSRMDNSIGGLDGPRTTNLVGLDVDSMVDGCSEETTIGDLLDKAVELLPEN